MTHLIGFTGKAGVGKDTCAGYLKDYHDWSRYAFAGPIKAALEAMGFPRREFDIDGTKDEVIPGLGVSYRKLAQTLGTEWGRALHPDFWLVLAKRFYFAQGGLGSPGLAISDVRFNNEAEWIRSVGGVIVHIEGPARRPIATDGAGHASEAGVERLPGDVIVNNFGDWVSLTSQLEGILDSLDDA